MEHHKPLIVDLDGALLRTDTLHETLVAALRHPSRFWRAAAALPTRGKAAMKQELALGDVDLRDAPKNTAVVQLIERRAADGGMVLLATGADERVAAAVAASVPGLSLLLASDGSTNLTGAVKSSALVDRFGERGFDYVGNSPEDRAIWAHADRSYLATLKPTGVPSWASSLAFEAVLRDPSPPRWRSWVKAVRVHQSLKNVLVFLPLIAAHELMDISSVIAAFVAFFSFTLMAFGVYLLNDTMDLAADRAHHRKRRRPLADGRISPIAALMATGALAVSSVALGTLLGPAFVAVLLVYAVMTTAYSLWLKRVALVDIVVLALLYMIRIVAGAVATGIQLSFWFTAVTLFLFLSLALVKRYAEAHQARGAAGVIPGRGYSGDDVHAILALGTATGVAAVLLTAIYIQSDAVTVIYPAPGALWLVIPVFFYWIANLWLKAGRGEMHDDPLVFALRDRASLAAAALIVAVVVVASLPAAETLFTLG